MRLLFTATPVASHFYQLAPLARAAQAAGHTVAVAAPSAIAPAVAAAGVDHLPAGLDADIDTVFPHVKALPRLALAPFFQQHVFPGAWAERMIPDLLRLAYTWRPDVIVREEREYGGCVAAECLGIPHAVVAINLVGDFAPRSLLAEPLAARRAAQGLAPDPELAMLYRYMRLVPFPRRLQDPALPDPPTAHHLRSVPFDRTGDEGVPAWVAELPRDRPVVYVGLGTMLNRPAVFRAFLDGLRDARLSVVVTVGRDQDPATYGPQPPHIHVARYIPLSLLLAHCDVVVSNGGSGTVSAALAQGLPLVVVPIGADQPANAARLAAAGAAVVVEPEALDATTARAAIERVLRNGEYQRQAQTIRTEIAALPELEHAVALLEQLAVERQPILQPAGITG